MTGAPASPPPAPWYTEEMVRVGASAVLTQNFLGGPIVKDIRVALDAIAPMVEELRRKAYDDGYGIGQIRGMSDGAAAVLRGMEAARK